MTDAHSIRTEDGEISITPAALAQLVVQAAEQVDGARVRRPRRGLEISVVDGAVRVEVELAARYGTVLPEVARAAQQRIADVLREMCGLEVEAVDVAIEELER